MYKLTDDSKIQLRQIVSDWLSIQAVGEGDHSSVELRTEELVTALEIIANEHGLEENPETPLTTLTLTEEQTKGENAESIIFAVHTFDYDEVEDE